jgi:hypothetical protein
MDVEIDRDNLFVSPIADPVAPEKLEGKILKLVKKRKLLTTHPK